jgi:hypothetical protein
MTRFVGRYNGLLERSGGRLVALEVIHGKGQVDDPSRIREALRELLRKEGKRIPGANARLAMMGAEYLFDNCGRLAYMHGEDIDRNGGKTVVVPRERIRLPAEYKVW